MMSSQGRGLYSTSTSCKKSAEQPVPHPILHADLLSEIFTHCIPETDADDWRFCLISNRDAPLLLCRVCSFWRSVAISTPRLWHTFTFQKDVQRAPEEEVKSLFRGIGTWLERSGSLPLTIRFSLSARRATVITRALKVLFEFSSRWESLLIDVSPSVRWPATKVLPNLRDFQGGLFPMKEFPFTSAPNLKSLRFYRLPPNPTSMSHIPWCKLTELIVTREVPITVALELFQSCPLLEKLSISVGSTDGGSGSLPPPSVNRIKLDALRCLQIAKASSIVVEYLTLPALEVYTMSDSDYNSQVLDLLTRSQCQLRKLIITRPEFTSDQLLEYLNHPSCQTLISLIVDQQGYYEDDFVPIIDEEVLSQLTYSEEQDRVMLCPKLADLSFKLSYRSQSTRFGNALGRMVQSRCASDEHIKSLELHSQDPISPGDKELLDLARDQGGLKLSFTPIFSTTYQRLVRLAALF